MLISTSRLTNTWQTFASRTFLLQSGASSSTSMVANSKSFGEALKLIKYQRRMVFPLLIPVRWSSQRHCRLSILRMAASLSRRRQGQQKVHLFPQVVTMQLGYKISGRVLFRPCWASRTWRNWPRCQDCFLLIRYALKAHLLLHRSWWHPLASRQEARKKTIHH